MTSQIDGLTEIQKQILKNRIIDQPEKPFGFSISSLYGDMDIEKYSEIEVQKAIDDLVTKELFVKNADDSYIFSREQFLTAKSHFIIILKLHKIKKSSLVFIKFIWKYFIVTIIAAVITSYVTTKITLKVNNNINTDSDDKQTASKLDKKNIPDGQTK